MEILGIFSSQKAKRCTICAVHEERLRVKCIHDLYRHFIPLNFFI